MDGQVEGRVVRTFIHPTTIKLFLGKGSEFQLAILIWPHELHITVLTPYPRQKFLASR